MTEKKNLTAIAAVLLVVLAISLLSMVIRINLRLKKLKKPAKPMAQQVVSTNAASESDLETYFSKIGLGRNPFLLGGPVKDAKEVDTNNGGYQLTAIIWDEARPMAIVNNKVVGIGSEIGGAKISSIEKNKVKLNSGDKIIELELYLKGGKKYEK
jgi:hypothetical protein